ncbi:MAG: DeoR/GlpR family DNA-binding transcription regulator [Jhaorihella sp.]
MLPVQEAEPDARPRLRKRDRRSQILLELKLRPHLRISELAERFGVSTETVRRDFEALSADGLLNRAHGGGSAPGRGHYPGLDERSRDRLSERERIGRLAATLVEPGDAVMIDAGSTTLQLARFLAFNATSCTVLTNSLPVAMTMGQSDAAGVMLCPGDYLASESAVVGADAVEFIERHSVDRCFIGASGLSGDGASETVRGFAAIKRAMLRRSALVHLLIDSGKIGARGFARVGGLDRLSSVVTDAAPGGALGRALENAGVAVMVTP